VAGYQRAKGGGRIEVQIAAHSVGICHSDGAYSRGRITSRRTHMEANVYGATPAEVAEYGNLNLWQSLMLLQKWSPLLKYGQAFMNEADPYKRSIVVADAVEWLASQTKATVDDELVKRLSDVLKTPQGEALVRWIVVQAEALR
jgi:hypothetical protein